MFDWDKDYDGLIAAGPKPFEPDAADAPKYIRLPRFTKVMILGAVLLCTGAFGYTLASKSRTVADLTQLGLKGFAPFGSFGPPVALQVLEDSQSARFQAGLRRFSEPDLMQYASTTRKDLDAAAGFMQPYLADALVLIDYEISRRGR